MVLFCCRLAACDAEVVAADSFHVHLTVAAAAGDELAVVHDDFGSAESGDAALLVAADGMAEVDGSSGHRVGSSLVAVLNSYRGCYAAVYPGGTGVDQFAADGAVGPPSPIGSVDVGVAVTVGAAVAGEGDFELDQVLANESSALLVVVPCSVVADTAADDVDGVFRCHRRDRLRPSLRHYWGHSFQRLVVLQAETVQPPAGGQLAAE